MKITIELSEKAEKYFNEIKYSLAKNEDGSGIATNSQCINWALEMAADVEMFLDGADTADLENIIKSGIAQLNP